LCGARFHGEREREKERESLESERERKKELKKKREREGVWERERVTERLSFRNEGTIRYRTQILNGHTFGALPVWLN